MKKRLIILSVLFGNLLIISSVCFAWGKAHWMMTQAALKVQPEWIREKWEKEEPGFKRYCMYPDMGLKTPESKPYLFVNPDTGRLMHYFPKGENEEDYKLFIDGADYYYQKIIGLLKAGKYLEASKFAGAFSHVLEDASHPGCHCIEGINGFRFNAVDELLTPMDNPWPRGIMAIAGMDRKPGFKVDISGYKPKLLGTYLEEAVYRTYQRYTRIRSLGRKGMARGIMKIHDGDPKGAMEEVIKVARQNAKLIADMYYTCFCIAFDKLPVDEVAKLKNFDLTTLKPIFMYHILQQPYRFSALAWNCSVDPKTRKPVPLKLLLDKDGKQDAAVFDKGFGTGVAPTPDRNVIRYLIPPNTFSEFECYAGLHADLGKHKRKKPNLIMKVKFNNKEVYNSGILKEGSMGNKITVPIQNGGELELIASAAGNSVKNWQVNHAVWAQPVFKRIEGRKYDPKQSRKPMLASPPPGKVLFETSFEEWDGNGNPQGVQITTKGGATFKQETGEVHSGKSALRFDLDEKNSFVGISGPMNLQPEKKYRFTFYWKSPQRKKIASAIKHYSKEKKWVSFNGMKWINGNSNPYVKGNKDEWNKKVIVFPGYQEPLAIKWSIMRGVGNKSTDQIFIDDIKLEEIE